MVRFNWLRIRLNENKLLRLTFTCPCIANIFLEYNQQDATILNLFISVRRSTCFRRFSVHHQEHRTAHTASDRYCYLLLSRPRLAAGIAQLKPDGTR